MNKVTPMTAEGQEFEGPPRTLSMARILAFSGGPIDSPDWPARNLHTDADKAKEAGLSIPIASGLQYQGHLFRLLEDLIGETWSHHGKMHAKYPRPVNAGDTVVAKVRIQSKQETDEGTAIEMEVWCENQNQEKVLVGTASCVLA